MLSLFSGLRKNCAFALLILTCVLQPLSTYIFEQPATLSEFCELEGEEDMGSEKDEDLLTKWNHYEILTKRKIEALSESLKDDIATRHKMNAYKEFQSEIPVPPPKTFENQLFQAM